MESDDETYQNVQYLSQDEKEEVGFFISFIRWHSFLFLSFLCSEGRSNDISLSLSSSLSLTG